MKWFIRKLTLRLFKSYIAFAILNILYKCLRIVRISTRSKTLWKHLPGEDCDISGGTVVKNMNRISDWLLDVVINSKANREPFVKIPNIGPMLYCNTEESVKWMLKDEFENITKVKERDPTSQVMNTLLGNGIFLLRHGKKYKKEDKLWHKERKTSARVFTHKNMSGIFQETFEDKSNKVIKRMNKSLQNGKVQLDMQDIFFSFTMDSIEKFFMGKETDSISGGMSSFGKNFDKASYFMMKFSLNHMGVDALVRSIIPYPFGSLVGEHLTMKSLVGKFALKFNKDHKEFIKAVKGLDEEIYKYIENTKKDPNLKKRKDIVASFLNGNEEMSNERIRDIVLNLTLAGRDTTACIMSWFFFELTQNPQVQQKLLMEIDQKFSGKVPNLEQLAPDNVPYLNGVLYETLRLHPGVPWDAKRVSKDVVYKDGTKVPEGTLLLFAPYVMGRNSNLYHNPKQFKPERWIPFKAPSLFKFPVFQAGPRSCLGKDLAQFEVKFIAVKLLQQFSFKMDPKEAKKISYSINLTASVVNNEEKTSTNLWLKPIKR